MQYQTLVTVGTVTLQLSMFLAIIGVLLIYGTSLGTRGRGCAVGSLELAIIALAVSLFAAIYREKLGIAPNVAVIIGGVLAIKLVQWRWGNPSAKSHVYGSADWATDRDLARHGLLGDDGLRLGYTHPTRRQIHYTGDRHLLTVAPTRTGKGVAAIIPNLLTYPGSTLVIDPKGENARITVGARQALGHDVFVLDPWGITGLRVAQFNPLDHLDETDENFTDNATMLADAMVVPTRGGNEFFDHEATSLLKGLILHVCTHPMERHRRHLGRVRELLALDKNETDALFQTMYASEHTLVSASGAKGLQKDPKTLANVLAATQTQSEFLDSPHIRENLMQSSFAFDDLKSKKTSVYLVLPANQIGAFHRWLRLIVQCALMACARDVDIPGAPDEKPAVLFLLDEMAALGRLNMIEQAYGLMAGFRMQLWGVVQSLSQLENIYGKGWETMISNAGVLQYFGSRDKMTSSYFSALCGTTTVQTTGRSEGRSSGRVLPQGANEGTSISDAQRPLIFPDELSVLPDDQQILLVENVHPIRAIKAKYFEDKALMNRITH